MLFVGGKFGFFRCISRNVIDVVEEMTIKIMCMFRYFCSVWVSAHTRSSVRMTEGMRNFICVLPVGMCMFSAFSDNSRDGNLFFDTDVRYIRIIDVNYTIYNPSHTRPPTPQPIVRCRLLNLGFGICFRGFGFITFADPASVDKVLAQGSHELDGKKVSALFSFFLIYVCIYTLCRGLSSGRGTALRPPKGY